MSIQDLSAELTASGTAHRIVLAAAELVGEKLQAHYIEAVRDLLKANNFVHVDDVGGLEKDKEQAVSVRKVPGSGTPGKYYLRIVLADQTREFETVAVVFKRSAKGKIEAWLQMWPKAKLIGDTKALDRFFTQLAEHYRPVVTASYDSDEADALTIHFKSTSERNKDRKKAKIYRQKNKAKLRLKAKKYALKMKHKKPNALRSRIAKLVAKHYHH